MSFFLVIILGTIAIVSGILILIGKKPVYSVSLLVLALLSTAGIYGVLGAPFVAAVQILVYAGAGVVMMVFVVMFYKKEEKGNFKKGIVWLSSLWALVFLLDILIVLPVFGKSSITLKTSTKALSEVLIKKYTLPFELITLLIVVGIIGVLILGKEND